MKNRGTAVLFALFLGGIGGHKFYLNKPGLGLIYLLFCWTFIPLLFSLGELIYLIVMGNDEFNRIYNSAILSNDNILMRNDNYTNDN